MLFYLPSQKLLDIKLNRSNITLKRRGGIPFCSWFSDYALEFLLTVKISERKLSLCRFSRRVTLKWCIHFYWLLPTMLFVENFEEAVKYYLKNIRVYFVISDNSWRVNDVVLKYGKMTWSHWLRLKVRYNITFSDA